MVGWRDWPGKSAVGTEGSEHPAAFHMLDVAAVAERLIAPFGFPSDHEKALIMLVALHDLGKLSESFRRMLREGAVQDFLHWELTEALLYANDVALASSLGGTPEMRQALYASTAGHHGRPCRKNFGALPQGARRTRDMGVALRQVGEGAEAASELIRAFGAIWQGASLDRLDPDDDVWLTWWLPGLCAVADWVGSNAIWFPPRGAGADDNVDLDAYFEAARRVASVAVREAGIGGAAAREGTLFDFALRPLQAACLQVKLTDGPMLVCIEDETSSGKTAAAFLLAHRMVLAGKGRGIFFALPTMATADAMFIRAANTVGRMFEMPSVTLAHGRAALSDRYRDVVQGGRTGREEGISSADWLAQDNRRALLADVGIGTIDQVLLATLPVRYQTLRLFGISSKLLIIDEVHEFLENYTCQELVALLRIHHRAGGSAILLTATLPLAFRKMLLEIYGGASDDPAYPALTVAGGARITSFEADMRPRKGPVEIVRLNAESDAVAIITEMSARGAACVWLRNAVDDAVAAFRALRAAGVNACLLHARFALCDRKRIEAEILEHIGRNGKGREGYVVVSTQVLEMSLDYDVDTMISDLAPMASLIQRAGRLWRHLDLRPAATRPVPKPVLHVLSPDPNALSDDRWLHGTLGRGAWVYALPDQWRTARVLFEVGRINAPHDLRALIEAVHGENAIDVPPAVVEAEKQVKGENLIARRLALQNIVSFREEYRSGASGDDDARYPTRLGEETITLCLARRTDDGLVPWADRAGAAGWALSEVSVRLARVRVMKLPDQSGSEIVAVTRAWPEWLRRARCVCPVSGDGAICAGLRYDSVVGLDFVSLS